MMGWMAPLRHLSAQADTGTGTDYLLGAFRND